MSIEFESWNGILKRVRSQETSHSANIERKIPRWCENLASERNQNQF